MRERAIVLVVDDEPEVCTSLKRLLESAGLEESLAHLIHISEQLGLSFRGRDGGHATSTPPPWGAVSPKVFASKEISLDLGIAQVSSRRLAYTDGVISGHGFVKRCWCG
jgi:CheY-like chemotaxis protein